MSDYPMLTVMELAERWRISRSAAYRVVREQRVRSVRVSPRTIRVPLAEVEAYERGSSGGEVGSRPSNAPSTSTD